MAALLFYFASFAWTATVPVAATGACNQAISGDNNKLVVNCDSRLLSPSDKKMMGELLPKLSKLIETLDPDQQQKVVADLNAAKALVHETMQLVTTLDEHRRLSTPTISEYVADVVLMIGGAIGDVVSFPLTDLRGRRFRTWMIDGFEPIISVEGNRLFVDLDIWTAWRSPVLLRHNKLVNRPPQWEMNSNDRAMEVVDEYCAPVFQIVYKNESTIIITGDFFTPAGTHLVLNDGIAVTGPDENLQRVKLSRIFKYPAWKYPGQIEQ